MDWFPIDGFPAYDVNPLGEIRHARLDRLVLPIMNRSYSVYVCLWRDGQHVKRSLASLVARMFLDPPPDEHFDTPINLDGDRFNCAVENLAWRPRWFSIQYHRQFREPPVARIEGPLRSRDTREVFFSSMEAATAHGLLEHEVVLSVYQGSPVFPTYELFEYAG